MELDDWNSKLGICSLELDDWNSKLGICSLELERWSSELGICSLELDRWSSALEVCSLELEQWRSALVRQQVREGDRITQIFSQRQDPRLLQEVGDLNSQSWKTHPNTR